MSTTIPNEGADEEIDSLEADAPGRKPAFEEGMDQAVNRRGFLLRGALGVLGAAIGGKALSTPAHTVDHGRSGVHDEAMDVLDDSKTLAMAQEASNKYEEATGIKIPVEVQDGKVCLNLDEYLDFNEKSSDSADKLMKAGIFGDLFWTGLGVGGIWYLVRKHLIKPPSPAARIEAVGQLHQAVEDLKATLNARKLLGPEHYQIRPSSVTDDITEESLRADFAAIKQPDSICNLATDCAVAISRVRTGNADLTKKKGRNALKDQVVKVLADHNLLLAEGVTRETNDVRISPDDIDASDETTLNASLRGALNQVGAIRVDHQTGQLTNEGTAFVHREQQRINAIERDVARQMGVIENARLNVRRQTPIGDQFVAGMKGDGIDASRVPRRTILKVAAGAAGAAVVYNWIKGLVTAPTDRSGSGALPDIPGIGSSGSTQDTDPNTGNDGGSQGTQNPAEDTSEQARREKAKKEAAEREAAELERRKKAWEDTKKSN